MPLRRETAQQDFVIEALEPRLLLSVGWAYPAVDGMSPANSADAIVVVVDAPVDEDCSSAAVSGGDDSILDCVTGETLEDLERSVLPEAGVDDPDRVDNGQATQEDLTGRGVSPAACAADADGTAATYWSGVNEPPPQRRTGADDAAATAATDELVDTLHAANPPPMRQPPDGMRTTVAEDQVLSGNGGHGSVVCRGTLSPGHSPGVLTEDSLVLADSSTTVIELAGIDGPGEPTGHDQIHVTGAAELGGTMTVSLLDGFMPEAGQTFEILTYGSATGEFDVFEGLWLGEDLYLQPIRAAGSYTLEAVQVSDAALAQIQGDLEALGDEWFDRLAGAEGFDLHVPFLDDSLEMVLDFGTAYDFGIVSALDFGQMESFSDFVTAVEEAGILSEGAEIEYDPVEQRLTFPMQFDVDLHKLDLRALDALDLVDVDLLEAEGLVQVGARVDLDDLLDRDLVDLSELAERGLISMSDLEDLDSATLDALAEAGVLGANAVAETGIVDGGSIDLDDLLDEGLADLIDLVDAGLLVLEDIASDLGWAALEELTDSLIGDLGFELSGLISGDPAELIDIQDLLSSGLAELTELFTEGILDLADVVLEEVPVAPLLSEAAVALSDLVSAGLASLNDFADSAAVSVSDMLGALPVSVLELIDEDVLDGDDFNPAALIDLDALLGANLVDTGSVRIPASVTDLFPDSDQLLGLANAGMLAAELFAETDLSAESLADTAGVISRNRLNALELIDDVGDVDLHELLAGGTVSVSALVHAGLLSADDLLDDAGVELGELLDSGLSSLRDVMATAEVFVDDALDVLDAVLPSRLDLSDVVDSGLASLQDLADHSLLLEADFVLDTLSLRGLIEAGVTDLAALVESALLSAADLAVGHLLTEDVYAAFDGIVSGDLDPWSALGEVVNLADLLDGTPVELRHLVYYGILDRDVLPDLDAVAEATVTDLHVMDHSLVGRYDLQELAARGFLSVGDLVERELVGRSDLRDLGYVKLASLDLDAAAIALLEADGVVEEGDQVDLAALASSGVLSLAELVAAGVITEDSLIEDLPEILLSDLFVLAEVERDALLASDLAGERLLQTLGLYDPEGGVDPSEAEVAVADLVTPADPEDQVATLQTLIQAGLLSATDFDSETALNAQALIATRAVSQRWLTASGLVDEIGADSSVTLNDVLLRDLADLATLARFGFLSVTDLADPAMTLTVANILGADVADQAALADAGIGDGDRIDAEELIEADLGTLAELENAGLVDPDDYYENSLADLGALVEAGLVDADDFDGAVRIPLEDLLATGVIAETYVDNAIAFEDDDGDGERDAGETVTDWGILEAREDLNGNGRLDSGEDVNGNGLLDDGTIVDLGALLDVPGVTFEAMVAAGLFQAEDFIDKEWDVEAVETILDEDGDEEGELLFEDVDFDEIVDLGDVTVGTITDSILYTVTLGDLVDEGFLAAEDFTNLTFDTADLEATDLFAEDRFSTSDALVPMLFVDAAGSITLENLLSVSVFVTVDLDGLYREDILEVADFTDEPLDVPTLEASLLYEEGELTGAGVSTLHDLLESDLTVSLNALYNAGEIGLDSFADLSMPLSVAELEATDLYDAGELSDSAVPLTVTDGQVSLHNLANATFSVTIDDLFGEGLVTEDDFANPDKGLGIRELEDSALFEEGDLNNYISKHTVHLEDLADHVAMRSLASHVGLVDGAPLVEESDLLILQPDFDEDEDPTLDDVKLSRLLRSNVLDQAILDNEGLIVWVDEDGDGENDQEHSYVLASTLLASDVATLAELVNGGALDPSHLDDDEIAGALVDLDDLFAAEAVELEALAAAGVITSDEIAGAGVDLGELAADPRIDLDSMGLDELLSLGVVSETFVDGVGTLALSDLEASGLVTRPQLEDEGLLATGVDCAGLIDSGLVTVQELIDNELAMSSVPVDDLDGLGVSESDLVDAGLFSTAVDVVDLLDSGLVTLEQLLENNIAAGDLAPLGISEAELIGEGLLAEAVGLVALVNSELVSIQDLIDGGLLDSDLGVAELLALNLITGSQMVEAGLILEEELEDDPDATVSVNSLLGARKDPADPDSAAWVHLVDLVHSELLPATVSRSDVTDAAFEAATGVELSDADLIDEDLYTDRVSQRLLLLSGLADESDLEAAGLLGTALIGRADLDDLETVDTDMLPLPADTLAALHASGLVDADGRVDMDDLLDEIIAEHGTAPLADSADLTAWGLVDWRAVNGYEPAALALTDRPIVFPELSGEGLVGLTTDATANLDVRVGGQFDFIVDLDGEAGGDSEGDVVTALDAVQVDGHLSYEVKDLDVDARLGWVGVTLADVDGAESSVAATISRSGSLTSGDGGGFLTANLVNQPELTADNLVVVDHTLTAGATLEGITVQTGLGGVPVANDARISLDIPDLTRPVTDGAYADVTFESMPASWDFYESLHLEDVFTTVLRLRDYMRNGLDQLPFWATDPEAPGFGELTGMELPVIGESIQGIFALVQGVDDAISAAERFYLNPDNNVQKLVHMVMDQLGIDPESEGRAFELALDGGIVRADFQWEETLSEEFPFDLDLAAFKGISDSLPAGLDGIDELVSLDLGGTVSLDAYISFSLAAGIDLSPVAEGGLPTAFLYEWDGATGTSIEAGFRAAGTELELGFEVLDAVGVETVNDAEFDMDGDGVLDDELYDASVVIDGDGDVTTTDDYVSVSFRLDDAGPDGRYTFDESLMDSVSYGGVDGSLEVFLPLQLNLFGAETPLTGLDQRPLRIYGNPVYEDVEVDGVPTNQVLEQVVRHLAGGAGEAPGAEAPVLMEAPNIVDALQGAADAAIEGWIEDLADLVADLKTSIYDQVDLDTTIPGTDLTLNGIFGSGDDNGLPDYEQETGLKAFLDLDQYVLRYAGTVDWVSDTPAYGEVGTGLVDFLDNHWIPTLPTAGGALTYTLTEDGFSVAMDADFRWDKTLELDLNEDLGGTSTGLEVTSDVDLELELDLGLRFEFGINWSGAGDTFYFDFHELSFDVSALTEDADLGVSFGPLGLSTLESASLALSLGGTFTYDDDTDTADFDTAGHDNILDLELPLHVDLAGVGAPLVTILLRDSDLLDGTLPDWVDPAVYESDPTIDPVFTVTGLDNLDDLVSNLAFGLLESLAGEVMELREEVTIEYDETGRPLPGETNVVNENIPGTDTSLDQLLGISDYLSLGHYVKIYLELSPTYDADDFDLPATFDGGGSAGEAVPAYADEGISDYYDDEVGDEGDPTMLGLLEFLAEHWLPTPDGDGAEGSPLSWSMPDDESIFIDFRTVADFTRTVSLDLGTSANSIGFSLEANADIDVDISATIAFGLMVDWSDGAETPFEFTFNEFSVDATARTEDLVIPAMLGPLSVQVGSDDEGCEKGTVAINLAGGVLRDPVTNTFDFEAAESAPGDRKSTRLNSSHYS